MSYFQVITTQAPARLTAHLLVCSVMSALVINLHVQNIEYGHIWHQIALLKPGVIE